MPATQVRAHTHPAALTNLLDHIAEHAHLIEFPDNSAFSEYDDTGDDAIATLADMSDTLWASNNCDTASTAVRDAITHTKTTHTTGLVELIWTADDIPARHYATTITLNGTIWVIDYTARQFDPLMAFPLVGTLQDWTATITDAVEAEWGWTNPVPHLH